MRGILLDHGEKSYACKAVHGCLRQSQSSVCFSKSPSHVENFVKKCHLGNTLVNVIPKPYAHECIYSISKQQHPPSPNTSPPAPQPSHKAPSPLRSPQGANARQTASAAALDPPVPHSPPETKVSCPPCSAHAPMHPSAIASARPPSSAQWPQRARARCRCSRPR